MNPDGEEMSTEKAMEVLQDVSQKFGKFGISQKEIIGMTMKEVKRIGMNMDNVRQAAAVLNQAMYEPPPEPLPLSKPPPVRARVPPLPELPNPPVEPHNPQNPQKPPLKAVNIYKYSQKDERELQARRRLQEKLAPKKKTRKFDPEQPSTSRDAESDEEKEEAEKRRAEEPIQPTPVFKTKRYYVF